MEKITYVDALNAAIYMMDRAGMCEDDPQKQARYQAYTNKLTTLRDQTAKHSISDKAKENRRAKTAKERSELVAKIAPILREKLRKYNMDITAKELFLACTAELPENFTANKVQNILLREMAPELVKTETKGKANTYRLK